MTKLTRVLTLALFAFFISESFAQVKSEMHHMNYNHKSHYASENHTEIKALTDEELNHLLNGEGMGLAKAGELNSYPGPRHVLDLSSELQLTPEQKEKTETLFNSMKKEAMQLGKAVIEKERELDSIFKANTQNEIEVKKNL